MVTLSLAVLAEFVMVGPFWAIATQSFSRTTAAVGIALINSVGNLGGFFGPSMMGLLRHRTGGFQAGLLVVSASLLVSGLVVLLVAEGKEGKEGKEGSEGHAQDPVSPRPSPC
jgi:ACS family tartrate transporter-like MFS transporter